MYMMFSGVYLEVGGIGQPIGGLRYILDGWAPCYFKATKCI